jgi:hypothetical protein
MSKEKIESTNLAAMESEREPPTITASDAARRGLLGLGIPAALSLLATACGSKFGAGAVKQSNKGTANPANLGGSGATNKDDEANPDSPEQGEPPAVATATATTTATAAPGEPQVQPVAGRVPGPCEAIGPGLVKLPSNTPPGLPGIGMKAYGSASDTMIVVKGEGFVAGQMIMLARVIDADSGKVIARRRVTSLDVATKVIIFDGVHLGQGANPKLTLVQASGTEQKRSDDFDVMNLFQRTIVHPAMKTGAYNIVDTHSIRDTNKAVYPMGGPHSNYFHPGEAGNRTVCMAFGNATNEAQTFGGQTVKAGVSAGRTLKRTTASSMWSAPSGAYLPGNGDETYWVCDAFGDPIPGLTNGRFSGTTDILRKYSTILVYVQDGGHFHRYFFNIG